VRDAAEPAKISGMAQAELVHPVPVEELPAWQRSMATAFLRDPDDPGIVHWLEPLRRRWVPEQAWGARAAGRWVATLRTESRRLTVPGPGAATRELTAAAITNVTVAATHRRQGLMRAMLGDALRDARERGDPLSILIAAEWPIYDRFGYAPATFTVDYALRRARPGSTPPGDPSRVREVAREEFAAVAAAVFEAGRAQRPGQVERGPHLWQGTLGGDGLPPMPGLPHHWFLHEGEDGPDGLLAWKADGLGSLLPPFPHVDVWLLATATAAAYEDMWAYLGGLDIVEEVRLGLRPVDEPVRWRLGDGRTLVSGDVVDFLWLRVLDVPAALAGRRYAVDGELVLEVADASGLGFASGRFRLAAQGDEVSCEPTTRAAELVLGERALASIYLGGVHPAVLAAAGAIREEVAGALVRAGAMFASPLAPWNQTWF
jgi:predicted acetyltransferase